MSVELVDHEARRVIREDTGRTLFVEAGAGSGKTTMLVQRVQQLTVWDAIPMGEIAAVTFTERAGAELRDRLRARLESAAGHGTDELRKARAEAALEELDSAAIGTLHSFARRILAEHPIEAGIPPLVEVLDEVASSVAFESRWSLLRTELLDSPEMAPTLEIGFAVGITLDHVRSLITKLNSDWDLVDEHVVSPGPPSPPQTPDVTAVLTEARRLAALAGRSTKPDDKFVDRLRTLSAWADLLDSAGGDVLAQLDVLRTAADLSWAHGQNASWVGRLAEIKGECRAWAQVVRDLVNGVVESSLRCIVHWCGVRVLQSARERQGAGRLEFHDLLVLTRNLLRDNAEVRATLQQRYRRLLLDEFQDTDPIQIEIAVRIAGGAAATQADWEKVAVPPGSLFVVGDPKQSIYRFRRADIAMYLRAQAVLGGDAHPDGIPADRLRELEAGEVARSIVQALDEGWTTEVREPASAPDGKGPTSAPDGKEPTSAPDRKEPTSWRPLRPGDITILIPARTSLPFLESALNDAGVMYRTESSSLVYHADEVRDLFSAARALADPSDGFALVTTLRSPLFGCGDDDLWTWKQARGSFNLLAPAPEGLQDHPVGMAIASLRTLHREFRWLTPSEILGRLAVDRRMFEVATGPRARDSWRRLRFVIDQARAWSEVEHGGLRSYLAWASAQAAEGSRVAESVLPESDTDSVRIMTIHAAKGLEFPMVVLSGMSAAPVHGKGVRLFWPPGGYSVRLSKDLETGDFRDQLPVDEQMSSYERLRLLYVAATRARDHLVVSMHRSGGRDTNACRLGIVDAANAAGAVPLPARGPGPGPRQPATLPTPAPDWDRWLADVTKSAGASRQQPAVSASGLEGTDPDAAIEAARSGDAMVSGSAKGGRDVELPAWSKGRYGSAIGRAVHGVLQVVDLASGEGLENSVAAQCVAEGVVEFTALVTALVRSAIESDVVKRAVARPHWRESYVGMLQADGTVLEGFVDLIYREDDGSLVVVDYKTDDAPDGALPARVAYYAPQVNAYKKIVATATGEPTAAPVLVFARESSARTLPVSTSAP